MNKNKIKNCPFCGEECELHTDTFFGSDNTDKYSQVICKNGHTFDALFDNAEGAIEEWNNRKIEDELIQALKKSVEIYKYCEKFAAYNNLPMDFIKSLDVIDIENILEKHTGKTIKELLK